MRKLLSSAFLISLMICGLAFVSTMPFGRAQAGTNVSSQIITQNTAWTQAGSPYTFTGIVGVASGVTLTIDAGVTINLGPFELNVNGSLNAQGTSTNNVFFNSEAENDWPPQNIILASGNAECTIQNAILNNTSITSVVSASLSVNNCVFNGNGEVYASGSTARITNNYINGGVTVGYSSTVSDNTILGGISTEGNSILISDNNITNDGLGLYGAGNVFDNIISGGGIGIEPLSDWTIEGNLITDCQYAISIDTSVNSLLPPAVDNSIIENNTISNNAEGIIGISEETIIFNNFESNGAYNLMNGQHALNATYNWWGTTNTQAINQTIEDSKDNYNLGTVTFVPFLTEPNPQASPTSTSIQTLTPTSTPAQPSSPSQTPTPTPTSTPTTSVASRSSSSTLPSQAGANTTSLLMELMVTGILVMVIVAVAVVAFLLGKKTGQKTGGIL